MDVFETVQVCHSAIDRLIRILKKYSSLNPVIPQIRKCFWISQNSWCLVLNVWSFTPYDTSQTIKWPLHNLKHKSVLWISVIYGLPSNQIGKLKPYHFTKSQSCKTSENSKATDIIELLYLPVQWEFDPHCLAPCSQHIFHAFHVNCHQTKKEIETLRIYHF